MVASLRPTQRRARANAGAAAGSAPSRAWTVGFVTAALLTPARVNRILLVPGGEHGVDLLAGASGDRVRAALLGFLEDTVG